MNGAVALEGRLSRVASPDQIISWTGIEAFGFATGGVHDQRTAGSRLVAITAQGLALEAALLKRRTRRGETALALGAARATLRAAAAAASPFEAGAPATRTITGCTVKTGAIATGALRAGTITTETI
jgi:hypothetical protein